MKVFISADIEGVATTLSHEDCRPGNPNYPYHCDEMTKEVLAACEGAMEAGADEIVIKDAHGPACNIDSKVLPPCAQIIKGWSGHPFLMVEGLDKSFDAALFVGYHGAASREGNPMSHTVSGRPAYIKLNGRICSEFMMFSLCAASLGVPTVYLSGDQQLCEDSQDLHPCLVTTAVKEGTGGALRCLAPPEGSAADPGRCEAGPLPVFPRESPRSTGAFHRRSVLQRSQSGGQKRLLPRRTSFG